MCGKLSQILKLRSPNTTTTSATMADLPSHPPQTPHDTTNQSVADANQAAPCPDSSLTPRAPAALLFHSIRRVSSLSANDEIPANTRPKRKAAAAAQRGWTVTPSPLTLDATGNSPTTSEGDADSNKHQRASADDAMRLWGDPTMINHL